jgi:hypothetical protein
MKYTHNTYLPISATPCPLLFTILTSNINEKCLVHEQYSNIGEMGLMMEDPPIHMSQQIKN